MCSYHSAIIVRNFSSLCFNNCLRFRVVPLYSHYHHHHEDIMVGDGWQWLVMAVTYLLTYLLPQTYTYSYRRPTASNYEQLRFNSFVFFAFILLTSKSFISCAFICSLQMQIIFLFIYLHSIRILQRSDIEIFISHKV